MNNVLYDSDIDGNNNIIFRNKILHHQHLYFIIIDDKNNVFGHYNEVKIDKTCNYIRDEQSFLFTLNNNGRCGIKKFKLKSNEYEHSVYIYNDNKFYFCGNVISGYCDIYSIGNNDSRTCDMSKCYENINKIDLIGVDIRSSSV